MPQQNPSAGSSGGSSPKAKNLSARMMAVQAVYQSVQNDQRLVKVGDEFLATRVGMEIDGEKMVAPDGALFNRIIGAVEDRHADIEQLVSDNIHKDNKDLGTLLHALLFCAAGELLVNREVEAGIIINDYLNVAHGFFDSGEVKLANAILDAVSRAVRD